MMERVLRKLMTADAMGLILFVVSLQVLTYGVSSSLRDTDTGGFFWICLLSASISYGLGKTRWGGIWASVGIASLGLLFVWILGARLAQPLLAFGSAVFSTLPQVVPAVRFGEPMELTAVTETWAVIMQFSSALWIRLQTWVMGFDEGLTINDALVRNMVWVFILWMTSAWMGWFAQKRNAVLSLLPAIVLISLVTSYSEYKIDSLWYGVVLLFFLMGVWNYRNHTLQWERRRIDFSESVRIDTAQAVVILTMMIGAVAFVTPSVSWQDIIDYIRERQTNETAEMLGIQEPRASGQAPNFQKPSLPRDHLLTGSIATSEKIVMTIRTGELPPIVSQPLTIDPPRYYWRSTVYDQYVGSGWVTSAVVAQRVSSDTPLIPGLLEGYRVLHLDINLREPEGRLFWSGILFSADTPFSAQWRVRPPSDLFAEQSALLQADIFAASSNATSYQAEAYIPAPAINELRSASTDYPEEVQLRYLVLPRSLPERVRDLAREITEGSSNPYDSVKAIESYLRENYTYDLEVPSPPEGSDVADYFLFDLQRGYCDYYATSMVVLVRSVGIPARFVSGYSPGSYDAPNAQYIVRELNAHSWVEVYFPGIGWIEFEPTASIPEIERSEDVTPIFEGQDDQAAAVELLNRFRLERILLWASPFIGFLVFGLIYFLLMERWLILRLAPETAIDRIYQRFYIVGRPLAGPWTIAETSSEYLNKLLDGLDGIGRRSRFNKLFHQVGINAGSLTNLYHRSLFGDYQVSKKDSQNMWQTWVRLRGQLFAARLMGVISRWLEMVHWS